MSRSADRPPPRPTREELLEAMARLSLTPGVAAERWRVGRRTLQRMCAGEQDIPAMLGAILALENGELEPRTRELDRAARQRMGWND